jgi:hypothetical protein
VAWGDNARGQTAVPVGLSGVIVITAGHWHNLTIKSDGTVVLWGDTTHCNNVPSGLAGVSGVAGGGSFCLVIVPNP